MAVFGPGKRPEQMSDAEWLTVGLVALAQFSEHAHGVLRVDNRLETEVSLISFDLYSRAMQDWLRADYAHRGFELSPEDAKTLTIQLGEKMLDLRLKLFDLPWD